MSPKVGESVVLVSKCSRSKLFAYGTTFVPCGLMVNVNMYVLPFSWVMVYFFNSYIRKYSTIICIYVYNLAKPSKLQGV